ncbi:hypothetical protein, partial [Nocardiopsis tropica]
AAGHEVDLNALDITLRVVDNEAVNALSPWRWRAVFTGDEATRDVDTTALTHGNLVTLNGTGQVLFHYVPPAGEDAHPDLDAIRAREQAASQEVYRLCEGGRFTMTVPPREDTDSDTVIVASLADIGTLVAEVERLRGAARASDEDQYVSFEYGEWDASGHECGDIDPATDDCDQPVMQRAVTAVYVGRRVPLGTELESHADHVAAADTEASDG